MEQTPLLEDYYPGENVVCFALSNVLSPEECKAWIAEAESIGLEAATINVGDGKQELDDETRKCQRCYMDNHTDKLAVLWERIKPFFPSDEESGEPVCLNPRLRLLKYERGGYFRPHYDGFHVDENKNVSLWTVQLYLNDEYEGGELIFYDDDMSWKKECKFKAGTAVIFDQEIYHAGSDVTGGVKWAVRTDIMFKKPHPEEVESPK